MYQAQRKYAKQAYGVPFSVLSTLMETAETAPTPGWDKDVMLLHSTGRCGSTLLSKLLGAAGSVRSLSEPDIYTNIARNIAHQPTVALHTSRPRHVLHGTRIA